MSPAREHQELLEQAIAAEARGHRALLDGSEEAAELMVEAAALYRRSWEAAPPRAFGRLVGMLKAALIAGGGGRDEAAYVRETLGAEADSPASWYAIAIAALIEGDDELARTTANGMKQESSDAFVRAANAMEALAHGDKPAYEEALKEVIADFEARDEHLTGVPIADTALMLERLAAQRGLAVHPESALLPRPR